MPAGWPYPRLLAHRGGGALAPENTLAAFDLCQHHGYRGAEVDAVLSRDAVPVLLHDEDLDRTTSGHGCVAGRTAAELALLDAGSWFGPQFAHARIPTLAEALRYCHDRGIWLNVEIKPVSGFEALTGSIVAETVARFQAGPGIAPAAVTLLSSFSRESLEAARRAEPQLPRGLLVSAVPPDWHDALQALDCATLHCAHRAVTAELAQQVTCAGFGLLCYTVNDPARARALWSWGVDAICTDRIDRIGTADDPGAARAGAPQVPLCRR